MVLASGCGGSPTRPTPVGLRVSSITPSQGSTTGGTAITIAGAEFGSDATVVIGGVTATATQTQGTTSLTATIGARAASGVADIVVTSAGQSATLRAAFTFVAPSGANQPPAVTNLQSVGSRPNQPAGFGDVGETVTLLATVLDIDTPSSLLSYEWSGPGTFTTAAATTAWRLPSDVPSTPAAVTATLTVTETYIEGAVQHRNQTSQSLVMQVHNSQEEIMVLAEDFLTRFTRSELPTDQVLHNFSRTCDGGRGRAAEAADVDRSRREYVQDFSRFRMARLPPVRFNFGGACVAFGDPGRIRPSDACAELSVHWEITYIDAGRVGRREITDGVDHVTAVLENNQWRLCHSDFRGTSINPTTGIRTAVSW